MQDFILNDVRLRMPDDLANGPIGERLRAGKYEEGEAAAARAFVRPGMRVLEIGTGLGYVSSICAQIAGAENVTCYEANPRMIDIARTNLDLNGHNATRVVHRAVVGQAFAGPEIEFCAGKHFWGSAIAQYAGKQGRRIQVPAVAISKAVNDAQPSLVMMDVEGAELDYMSYVWPEFVKTIVMEVHPKKYGITGVSRIEAALQGQGFDVDAQEFAGGVVGFVRKAARVI